MRQPGDNPRLDPRVNDLPYKDPVRATHVDSCSAWIMVFTFDPTDDNAFPRVNGVGWPGNSRRSVHRKEIEGIARVPTCRQFVARLEKRIDRFLPFNLIPSSK